MKVLITGGAGFIGSHLIELLVEQGYDVVVLDNMITGKKEYLANLFSRIEFINGDIREDASIKRALKGVEIVAHLASLTSVNESMKRPILYNDVNTTGTLKLLKHSVETDVSKFIFTSSCAVYGEPTKIPVMETDPINPLSIYATSKVSAEEYCRTYERTGRIKSTILRLFNVYGPRQMFSQYSGVITQFADRIKNGKPPIIYGNGEQTRDFIFVKDVANFIMKAIEIEASGTFNVGTGDSVTIKRLAEVILRVMSKEGLKPIFTTKRSGDIMHSRADTSKAFKAFNLKPKMNLEEGLRETIKSIM